MSDLPHGLRGARPSRPRAPLASTLVTYETRPDRRTVHPPGLSGVARTTTRLTADADAFVDLEAAR